MYEPLHHKYRPQTFAQLVGQRAISDTLTHALQQARIAPAYLFCGPRGTGKTSSARILAKSLNCQSASAPTPEPCGQCDVCRSVSRGNALDIVEIDAASNTGVDNIRELIERAQFAPVQCRYKVYAIDECHMLSTAAFNALLKTLEEPPDRVVFVLATTDPQRVLPTIISRCQRFDFRRIPLPAMIKHLSYIAAEEDIKIAESAVQLVSQISQGGLRDAESLLDQLSLQADEITVESVWDLVGAVPERDLLNLVRAIAADDSTALLDRTRHLIDKGREPLIVLQSLVGFYRDLLIAKSAPARADLVAITPPTWAEMTDFATGLSAAQLLASQQKLQSAEAQVKNTTQPRLWLEITLTGLLPSALSAAANLTVGSANESTARSVLSVSTLPAPATPAQSLMPRPSVSPTGSTRVEPPTQPAAQPTADSEADSKPDKSSAEAAFGTLDDLWAKILSALKPRGTQMLMSQQGVLLGFDGVGAKVGFRSASLQRMAQERIPNLIQAFEAVFQRPIKVSLEVLVAESIAESATKEASQPQSPAPDSPIPRAFALPSDDPPPTPPTHSDAGNQTNDPASSAHTNGQLANDTVERLDSAEEVSPTADPPISPSPVSPSSVEPSPAEPPKESAELPADRWEVNQDQDSIKRFAQFFNGQIVDLDDDSEGSPDWPGKDKSSDPGPDVPF